MRYRDVHEFYDQTVGRNGENWCWIGKRAHIKPTLHFIPTSVSLARCLLPCWAILRPTGPRALRYCLIVLSYQQRLPVRDTCTFFCVYSVNLNTCTAHCYRYCRLNENIERFPPNMFAHMCWACSYNNPRPTNIHSRHTATLSMMRRIFRSSLSRTCMWITAGLRVQSNRLAGWVIHVICSKRNAKNLACEPKSFVLSYWTWSQPSHRYMHGSAASSHLSLRRHHLPVKTNDTPAVIEIVCTALHEVRCGSEQCCIYGKPRVSLAVNQWWYINSYLQIDS